MFAFKYMTFYIDIDMASSRGITVHDKHSNLGERDGQLVDSGQIQEVGTFLRRVVISRMTKIQH